MNSPPPQPAGPVFARRTLMWTAGSAALLATAGCNPFAAPTKITQTVTASAAPTVDPLPGLIATTRLHLVRLTNAMAADQSLIGRLAPLRADRKAHLTALIAELARTSPQGAAAESSKPTADPTVRVPKGAATELLTGMRADAAAAQTLFTDAVAQASRYRAALFGSVTACLAAHRTAMA